MRLHFKPTIDENHMIKIGGFLLLITSPLSDLLAQDGGYLVYKHALTIDQQNIYYNVVIGDTGIHTYLCAME